ncbi:MAG: DMT family transporter [Acidimicrobiia bacterium]
MPGSPKVRALLALLVAAFLFGATFVVVKTALDDVGPLTFVGWRFLIGALLLGAFAFPKGRLLWLHGLVAGIALFAGYTLQTAGLALTSASNSALITGMYVVFTPLLAAAFSRRPPNPWAVGSAAVAFAGLILVTGTEGISFGAGDLLTLGCALAFALHILALARFARHHPVVPFTAVQLAVTAALALAASNLVEGGGLPPQSVWPALVVAGVAVGVGAFLLQIWAQTVVGPATAAVVLAAEPAFGVATAWVVLGERLDPSGWLGSALIVAAIFVAVTRQADEPALRAEAVTPAH